MSNLMPYCACLSRSVPLWCLLSFCLSFVLWVPSFGALRRGLKLLLLISQDPVHARPTDCLYPPHLGQNCCNGHIPPNSPVIQAHAEPGSFCNDSFGGPS